MSSKSIMTAFGALAMTLFLLVQTTDAQPPFGEKRGGNQQAEFSDRMDLGKLQNRRQRNQRGRRPGPEILIERFDKNGDGKLGADEVSERMQERFAQIDNDEDGFVTIEELKTAMAGRRGRGRGADMERGEKGAGGKGQRGNRSIDPARLIERMDKDADGKISLAEAPERMQDNFAKIDANGDGFVESSELKSAMEKMKQRRNGKGGKNRKHGGAEGDLNPVKPKVPPAEDFPL